MTGDQKNEFEEFVSGGENVTFDKEVFQAVSKKVKRDLISSPLQFSFYYIAVSFVGYFFSLVVCAQNALGIFSFSQTISMAMCGLSQPYCWIMCGALFTGVPFFISLVVLNRFHQRYLLFKMWWLLALVPIGMSLLMIVLPPQLRLLGMAESPMPSMLLSNFTAIAAWLLSALATPYVLETVLYFFIRQRRFHPKAA